MKKVAFLLLMSCVFFVGSVYAAEPLWWTPYGGEKSITSWADQVVSEFQQQSGTELKRVDMNDEDFKTGIQASFGAGNPPDLWYSWGGGVLKAYVGQGVVHDLTDLLNEDWAKERIPRSALGGSTFDGKHYGLPYTVWIGHLFINKGLFDKAGVAVPDADKGKSGPGNSLRKPSKNFRRTALFHSLLAAQKNGNCPSITCTLSTALAGQMHTPMPWTESQAHRLTAIRLSKPGSIFKKWLI